MINIEDFTSKINSEDKANLIRNHFEEVMVLYELIGQREDISISVTESEFNLGMKNKKDAKTLHELLNERSFSVYNNTYHIDMTLSNNSIATCIHI